MPAQRVELFALEATTPDHTAIHGSAMLRGSAEAGASFRRGIDLSASFEVDAAVSGDTGRVAHASLQGGASARAGVAVRASLPLDLFGEAGFIAEVRAQAEAAAYIRLKLGLSSEEFQRILSDQLPAGPLRELLPVALSEFVVEAGIWARASFSAQAVGELALVGTLLPTASGGPGFTTRARYAVGWGAGAGVDVMANVGIENPHRLLDRLSETMAGIVLREAQAAAQKLGGPAGTALALAAPVLEIVLPLSMGAAFRLGIELATAPTAAAREQAAGSIGESLIRLAQQQVLGAILKLALQHLGKALGLGDTALGSVTLQGLSREHLVEVLGKLRDELVAMDAAMSQDAAAWVRAANGCMPYIQGVIDALAPTQAPDVVATARHAVATLWAAGTLLERVLAWRTDPSLAVGDLFGESPVSVPSASTASCIQLALQRPSGAAVTLKDLVDFVVGRDLEQELRTRVPGAAEVLDFAARALATPAGGIVRRLLVDLARPGADIGQTVATALSMVLAQLVKDELVPKVLAPIKAANAGNVALCAFVDEMVIPTLFALPVVVLPRIASLRTREECLRMREALSAVLLQSLGRFVLACADALFARGLNDGAGALRLLSDEIDRGTAAGTPVDAVIAAASNASLPIMVTNSEVGEILRLGADIMDRWNTRGRRAVVDAVASALDMGLSNEGARNARLAAILDSDAAPAPQALELALKRTGDSLWDIVGYAGPRLMEIVAACIGRQIQVLATALQEGVKIVVAAALAAVQWLGEQLEKLRQRLAQLALDIAQRAAQLVADVRALSVHLRGLVSNVVGAIRDAGLRLIEPLLVQLPAPVRSELRALYRSLFDAAGWIATLPLQILEAAATWVEEVLAARIEVAGNDQQHVHDAVRAKIIQAVGADLHFDLVLYAGPVKVVDIGRVSLPAGEIAGAIAGIVLGDPVYQETVRTAAARSVDVQALRAQETATRQAYEGSVSQPAAQQTAADVLPGKPLAVQIATPAQLSVTAGAVIVNLRVDGANETFVRTVLGIPERVLLRVNGRDVVVPPQAWRRTPQGLALTLKVRVPAPAAGPGPATPGGIANPLVPRVIAPSALPRPPVTLKRTVGTLAQTDGAEGLQFMAASSAAPGVPMAAGTAPMAKLAIAPAGASLAALGTLDPGLEVLAHGAATTTGTLRPLPTSDVRVSGLLQKLSVVRDFRDLPRVTSRPVATALVPAVDADGAITLEGLTGLNTVQLLATDGAAQRAATSRVFLLESGSAAPPPRDALRVGDVLASDRSIASANGKYQLVFQGDGNLVLYRRGGFARWASATGARGGRTVLEADGGLVVYGANGKFVWTSNSNAPGGRLLLQDDGNVVIYRPDGAPAWSTDTWERQICYGTVIKLKHRLTGVALHSHTLKYVHAGTSRQQQVTGYAGADDNDLWRVMGPHGQPDGYRAGQPVANGDIIRLTHVLTGRNLHSHAGFPSPVTRQQEVTGFGERGRGDGNDNWRVELTDATRWTNADLLRLIHVATRVALHSHGGFSHPQWTAGQQEVTGFPGRDDNDLWSVSEVR